MELNSYEIEHIDLLRKLAPECMVLLKKDGTFPLTKPEPTALYGNSARNTYKGGTGSGDVNVRHYTTVEEGLENSGFTITTNEWLNAYDKIHQESRTKFVQKIKNEAKKQGVPAVMIGMGAVMPEPEYDIPLEGAGKLAIYVLGRESGEGADRKPVAGDLKLTETEIKDILVLQNTYEKFLLVLNVGGVVDLSPVMEVQNILLLSQLGMTTGDAFADVLLGKSYPSGKLTSTWASWEEYCKIGEFGKIDDTRYKEGVYVGYRYFDSMNKNPLFPFGFGLGYTTFSISHPEIHINKTKVEVKVTVENTGVFDGKEVVELYITVPSDKLDQPFQSLAAFHKTQELHPQECEIVTLLFDLRELASFDFDIAAKILEEGDYYLRLGSGSRENHICAVIRLQETVIVEQLSHVGGKADFDDWAPTASSYCPIGEYDDLKNITVYKMNSDNFMDCDSIYSENGAFEDTSSVKIQLDTFSNEELAYLCLGGFVEEGSQSVIGAAGIQVAGAAGETCGRLFEKGIPAIVMADGPAGLRLSRQFGRDENGIYAIGDTVPAAILEYVDEALLKILQTNPSTAKKEGEPRSGEIMEQYCSAIPIGTALAQSWNIELCEMCGDLVGLEMERFGVHLWLAPALNIHRSPLCGRNFEYYSEDPYISGKIAAGITRGVQKHKGCGVTVKHFACNNQETNRFRSNSIVNERTLRDLYLKGFEIVIREAAPVAIMTSYNLLNGEHTSHRSDLNRLVLRNEWGFDGLVMSDWVTTGFETGILHKHPYACASGSVKGGNDIFMPGTSLDYKDLMDSINNPSATYPLTRDDLLEGALHVVECVKRLEK